MMPVRASDGCVGAGIFDLKLFSAGSFGMSTQTPSQSNFQPWYTQRRPSFSFRPKKREAPRCGQAFWINPTFPDVTRNPIRFSPSRRTRTGGQSGPGSSLEVKTGIQYCRMRSPVGVPGPTRQSSSLSSLESMVNLLPDERSAKRRHDLAGEELHRAQHPRVLDVAEPEAAVEVRDAHELADAPDLADAGVRRADDEETIEEVVDVGLGRRRHRDRVALLDALVVVAQAERDAHVPARLLGGGPRIGDAVRDVDRALDADLQRVRWRDLGDGLVEEPAELGQALDRDAEPTGEHVEPAAHGRLQRIRALRRDPDRRMRFLERLREHRRLGDLEELAVVAEGPALEGFHDDVDGLVPALAPALELEAEPLELVVLVAAAEADVEAPAAQQVERGNLLGDHQWMVERHDDDGRAHPQPGRLRRDVRRELGGA